MKITLIFIFVIFLQSVVLSQTVRPPGKPPQQVEVVPIYLQECETFIGASISYTDEKKPWSNLKTKPILIGLVKGQSGLNLVVQRELHKFALKITRNIIIIEEPDWRAKQKFKEIISSNRRFSYLWLEGKFESFSLAFFHCLEPVCFGGSQAKMRVSVFEINSDDGDEYLVAAKVTQLDGHLHAFFRRRWLEQGMPAENLFYFSAGECFSLMMRDFTSYLEEKMMR